MTIIYFHIGMQKTGTSSIQATLAKSRKILAKFGVLYPSIQEPNHSVAITSLFSETPLQYKENIRRGIRDEKTLHALNKHNEAKLNEQLSQQKWEKIIISGEAICIMKYKSLQNMKAYFDKKATSYKIIFYAREPISYASSNAQQQVKAGDVTLEKIYKKPPKVGYRERLEKFIDLFGIDNIIIRHFDKAKYSLINDFFQAVDEPNILPFIVETKFNESLSQEAIRLLSLYNLFAPTFIFDKQKKKTLNPDRPDRSRVINTIKTISSSDTGKFQLPREVVAKANDWEDLKWFEDRFGKITEESFYNQKVVQEQQVPTYTESECLISKALHDFLAADVEDWEAHHKFSQVLYGRGYTDAAAYYEQKSKKLKKKSLTRELNNPSTKPE